MLADLQRQQQQNQSMNMDDLLKNLYSTSSDQFTEGTTSAARVGGDKTVYEGWKELVTGTNADNRSKLEEISGDNGNNTEEEMTLEDFLTRAGAVREEDVRLDGGGGGALVPVAGGYGVNGGGVGGQFGMEVGNHWRMVLGGGVSAVPVPVSVVGGGGDGGGIGKKKAIEEPLLDKATQQKQRRMIKNRESAARSRERKQEVHKMTRPKISASYKVTSAPPNSSTKRKSRSDVWDHFIKERDQKGRDRAKCTRCGESFSGRSSDGTTHLRNHWDSSKCKRSQKETGGLENPTVSIGNFVFNEKRSGLDLVRMIIKDGYPLNMVEHENFKILMKNLQPAFKLPSQDTLKDKILCFYREEKEKLCKQFDKVLSFSLILNFWTDCGQKSKYCSFTLQFIEDGPKLKKKNIAIKNVEYNHTGETLFEIVKGVLLEWNIDKKLASITVESSFANNQMVKILDGWLGDQGNCSPFRQQIFHIPCITHVINLLVKVGLDEIDYILHKIRKAIKYVSETTIGKQKLEEVVKKLNLGGKDITSEGVPLRWDSTFFMLQIALELRRQGAAIVDLQSIEYVFGISLSMEEWDKAEAMDKCLTVFYDAICSFLGSKCLSTNVYFRKIFDIFKSLNQWQESYIAKRMKERLDEYFLIVSCATAIVAVFDPRTKLDFVNYSYKQLLDDFIKYWAFIISALDSMFKTYAENLTSQRSSSSFINNDNSSSSDGNILDDWKKSRRTELAIYLQEPLYPDGEFDILGWWHTRNQDSPTLWTMARDILAIPMSTSTSNSAFYIETATLDPIFNDLDPDIIEALFCGKDWLDNPIRITPNKDNDHSPEPTYSPSVFAGTSSSLETQEKHAPFTADTVLMLGNPGSTSCPEPLPTRDTFLDLSSSSPSLEPQPQEKHNSSTANAEPMLENRGSISGPEPLAFVLESEQKHNSSNANTRLLLENIGSTSGPEPLPDGTAPEVGEILGRNEAQGLQHNSMRSQAYSWSPPPSSWLKFNVGAVVHYSNAFLAAVVRNDSGTVVEAGIALENVTSLLVAEALAFKYAVLLIKQYSVPKAIIEGDALLVVNALKERKTDASLEINGIVQEVFAVLDTCTDTIVHFSCVNKSCNSLAYDCIKWASRNGFFGVLPTRWFTGASFIGPSCV